MNKPPPGSPSVFTLTTAMITLFSMFILSLLPLSVAQSDVEVMQELRTSLSIPSGALNWASNTDPCNNKWDGVVCDNGKITRIQIGKRSPPLSGTLPPSLAKLSGLQVFEVMQNNITGPLPSLSGLSNLQTLNFMNNSFTSIPGDFFDEMTSLQEVYLDQNPLQGWTIPDGLMSATGLKEFSANECNINGTIPRFFNSTVFPSMTSLHLSYNNLQGGLPDSFVNFGLQSLWLNGQKGRTLSGSNILVIQNMTELTQIWLNMNGHTGPIPDLSQLKQLSDLNLRDNSLTGPVPQSVVELPSLTKIKLTNNNLQGPTPKFSDNVDVDMKEGTNSFCLSQPGEPCNPRVTALIDFLGPFGYPLDLAKAWTGDDPCSNWRGVTCSGGNITILNLKGASLAGTISPVLATLTSLQTVILSNNNITGTIPKELTQMTNLKTLDLSDNNLYGTVPKFAHGTNVITNGNPNIGKDPPPPAPSPGSGGDSTPGDSGSKTSSKGKIAGIVAGTIGAALILGFSAFCLIKRKRKPYSKVQSPNALVIHPNQSGSDDGVKITIADSGGNGRANNDAYSHGSSAPSDIHVVEAGNLVISIQVLRNVTSNFSQQNILGQGGFGTVYRGELHDGTKIAVKRMDSGALGDKGLAEFKSEIDVLTKVRHRHLVGLLGYCLDGSEKLLVYEYMPRGDLSRHLFSWKEQDMKPLQWKQRLTIALDVARGVEYLHNLAQQSFIHRDLKPSNILLGDDLRAKVSDFGLVRLAPDGKQSVATKLAGTFGYLAPEYAVMGRITTKVDVYSFGVILMELITGRKALDQTQPEESQHLVPWFRRMFINKESFRRAIDPTVDLDEETLASVTTVAELAGHCTGREPQQRPEMNHVVNVLSSLVEMWKPSEAEDPEDIYGIDFDMSLPQALKKWQSLAGNSARDTSSSSSFLASGDNTQTSIPTRPSGFAESFTSSDGR